ncbi:MAG: T9SS type B sorting domain-containing protein, partial [Bacteroidota bacterium]
TGAHFQTGFIENKGQIIDQNNKPNPACLYLLNTSGLNVQLRKGGFSYDVYNLTSPPAPLLKERGDNRSDSSLLLQEKGLRDEVITAKEFNFHRLDLDLLNYNPNYKIITFEPSIDYLNFYTTATPTEGVTNVRHYKTVTYKNIYPGIDLEFIVTEKQGYKYNFVIHPGGNINNIKLKIIGPDQISQVGDTLRFSTSLGIVDELIPESYFLDNNSQTTSPPAPLLKERGVGVGLVKAHFQQISQGVFGFSVEGETPENATLIIDPTCKRLWGTYYGGLQDDRGMYVAIDPNHNAILTGWTYAPINIATIGAFQETISGWADGFVAKFTANGVRLWGTYYGYSKNDFIYGTTIDLSGNIFVGGNSGSPTGMGTPGCFQATLPGINYGGFLAKFSPAGMRLWGTYYGGLNAPDEIYKLATDQSGNVYFAAQVYSDGLGTAGAYQTNPGLYGTGSAHLAKFTGAGIRLWATYYGLYDKLTSVSIDNSGTVYIAGWTWSTDSIASPGAYQTTFGGGVSDAFLAAFTPDGQRLWCTYYGGPDRDSYYFFYQALTCTTDNNGYVYLSGYTRSPSGIASPGSHQETLSGPGDGYLAKFNSSGQRIWATYLGGSDEDEIFDCVMGSNNDLFVTGASKSTDGISTTGSYMPNNAGKWDAFLVKFNTDGVRQWGTYFGDTANDYGNSLKYVMDDTIYFAGDTYSTKNIATSNGHQKTFFGNSDAYLEKFIECWHTDAPSPITGPVNICQGTSNISYTAIPVGHAMSYTWKLPPGTTLISGAGTTGIIVNFGPTATTGYITIQGVNKCGDLGDSASLFVNIHPHPVPVISGHDTTCTGSGKVYTTAAGNSSYQWSISAGGVITAGGDTTDNSVTVTWNTPGLQTVQVTYTSPFGCDALAPGIFNVFVIQGTAINLSITASENNVCPGTAVIFTAQPVNPGTAPHYQWKVNGIDVGTDFITYGYAPINNDLVTCILTVNDTCTSNNPATSNSILMVVVSPVLFSVGVTPSANPVCQGDPVTFTATPNNGGTIPVFQWLVNGVAVGTDSVYTYRPADNDKVKCILSSNMQCLLNSHASDSVIIRLKPSKRSVDTTLCYGTPLFIQGAWQTTAGSYHDTLTTPVDCIRVVETNLNYKPPIAIDLGKDTTICNDVITLKARFPGGTYLWQDGSTDSVYIVTLPGDYRVVVGYDGCSGSDSIRITKCSLVLWFPNSFTPNGDGHNDTFHPVGSGFEKFSMRIYDRWGVMLFETSSVEPGWDGTYKGALCAEDTYVFKASYESTGGQAKQVTGTVTLLRN